MQQSTCNLRGVCFAQQSHSRNLKAVTSFRWAILSSTPAQRCTFVARSDKGNASSAKEGLGKLTEGIWKPRWLGDDDLADKMDRVDPTPDELYEAELSREKFLGRLAVIGLGAVLLSERLSGKGIVTALNMATGVPIGEIEPVLGLLVIGFAASGIVPIVRRWGLRSQTTRGKETGVLGAKADRKWGDSFQVATGRLAFLTLAGTVFAEATTGKGILALLNIETGVEITEIEAGLTFLLLLLFTEDLQDQKPPMQD